MTRSNTLWILIFAAALPALAADKVELKSGEVLEGTIKIRDDKKKNILFHHPILGDLTISLDSIQNMVDEAPAASPPAPPAWSQRLEFGVNGSEGNTQEFNLYSSYRAKYVDDDERINLDASFFLNKSDSTTTKEEFTVGILKDWLLPDSDWFYFAQARFDSDKFAHYDRRIAASAGIGYDWIKEENLRVTLRGGLGAARESGSNDNSIQPEGQLGGEFEWKISKHQSLNGSVNYYPDLEEPREFRAVGLLEWTIRFADAEGVAFKLGIKDEYESSVIPGIKHNDLNYFAALAFDF
jgi:putative salt-induced outer membrane protein YdiY